MFEEKLVEAGFKKFKPFPGKECKVAYQKSYLEKEKIKYFLNCYVYETPGVPSEHGTRYWFESQMYLPSGDSFEVKTVQWFFEPTPWNHKVNSLSDVEDFYEKIWKSLGCTTYN